MKTADILSTPANALTSTQRSLFHKEGYLVLPEIVDKHQLDILHCTMNKAIELSRGVSISNQQFDLEQGHCAEYPRLRRVAFADDLDSACWDFCANSIVTDIAADLLGPNVRFRDVFINFKWADGGAGVKWHQDIAFYPHTNTNTCQFLLALDDVTAEQGPLKVIPRSHKGQIYQHYDESRTWTGSISDKHLDAAGVENAIDLTGLAGTLSVHHSCTIHGSDANVSDQGRPMLVITYSSADAIPYTHAPYPSSRYGALVRGIQPTYAHHEELNMPLPPDWSGGYTSIFTHQESS